MSDEPTIIYIASDTRSGSTLLDMILNTDPEAVSVGELRLLQEYYNASEGSLRHGSLCTCGVKVSKCSFWDEVNQELKRKFGVEISYLKTRLSKTGFLTKISGKPDPVLSENISKLYETIFSVSNKRFIIDSSKTYDQLSAASQTGYKIKVIYLLRDGRGVVCSKKRRRGVKVYRGAYHWVRNNLYIKNVLREFSNSDIFYLKYEDLCNKTDIVIKNLSSFIDFKSIDVYKIPDVEYHNIAGSPSKNKAQKIEINEDKRWVSELTKYERLSYYIIAGLFHKKMGYKF